MPAATGYSRVAVQVTFVAAVDRKGHVLETWWSFAPDQVELKSTDDAESGVSPDQLLFKLNAYRIEGGRLPGVAFARRGGITVQWPYAQQPAYRDTRTYRLDAYAAGSDRPPEGPYEFTATVVYRGKPYPSPGSGIVLESSGT